MKPSKFALAGLLALAVSVPAAAETTVYGTTTDTRRDPTIHHRNVPDAPIWKNREFWRNEKERSGLPEFWDGTKSFFRKINPAPWLAHQKRKYEANRAITHRDDTRVDTQVTRTRHAASVAPVNRQTDPSRIGDDGGRSY